MKKDKPLSFGDDIRPGVYKLYSSFEKTRNYCRGKKLISFVLPEIGNGANNIVVSKLPEDKKIIIKNIDGPFYNSKIEKMREASKDKIDFCIKNLIEYSPPLSMSFIFDKKKESSFKTKFQKLVLKQMKEGIYFLGKRNYAMSAKKLSGLGFGLTPSGDDFLSGIVLAMSIGSNKDKARIIVKNCKTENLISYNTLKNHLRSRAEEKIKKFINSLRFEDRDKIHRCLMKVINKGHTSGSDFLSGFLFEIKNIYNLL